MAKLTIDLKKFKKIKSDDKTSTLQHPDGHSITIVHALLSPKMRGDVHALPMADGGAVNTWDSTPNTNMTPGQTVFGSPAKKEPRGLTEEESKAAQAIPLPAEPPPLPGDEGYVSPQNKAKGGIIRKMYADPQDQPVSQNDNAPVEAEPVDSSAPENQAPQMPADVEAIPQADAQQQPASITPAPDVQAPQGPPSPTVAGPQTEQEAAQAEQQKISQIPGPDFLQGYQEAQAGYQKQQGAESAFANAQAKAAADRLAADQALFKSAQNRTDTWLKQRDAIIQDIKNQHINPNHYMESMSTGKKVGTAIGLIMGGIGSGLTHQSNAALDFLNKQIDRDVAAQQMKLGKSKTILSALHEQLGDLNAATTVARDAQANIYADKLAQAAGQTSDQAAKARLLGASAQLKMKTAPEMQNLIWTNALYDHLNNPNSPAMNTEAGLNGTLALADRVNPNLAKEIRSRMVPGVGLASKPVPTETGDKFVSYNNLDGLLARAEDLQKNVYGKGGAWSVENRANAGNLQRELELNLKDMDSKGIRMNPEIMKKITDTIGGVGSVNLGGVAEKLSQLRKALAQEKQATMTGYGIKPFQTAAPAQTAAQWAAQNPNDPRAAKILQVIQRNGAK